MVRRALRNFFVCTLATVVAVASLTVHGNPGDLSSLGLEPVWAAYAQVRGGGDRVVSAELWLDDRQPREFAVVELSDRTISIPIDQLDNNLRPLGIEKAKAEASTRATRILGQSTGFEVVTRRIGQLRLVLTTSDGLVQCYDAESGRLLWSTPCGPSHAPAYPAALSRSGVVLVRGQLLYLLDWGTGQQIRVDTLSGGTANSVVVIDSPIATGETDQARRSEANSFALVADFKGVVEAFSFDRAIPPWNFKLIGRNVGKPVSLINRTSSAIATDIGWLYVFSGVNAPSVQFRYESGNPFSGSLASGDNAFYMGDTSGTVSKISALQLGHLEWSYRMSQSISAKPLVDFDRGLVYVSSEAGELTAIDDSTGYLAWNQTVFGTARIQAPITICNGTLICRTFSRSLAAYDAKTGQLLDHTPSLPLDDLIIPNNMTDRLYLLGLNGHLMCYRPIGKSLPRIPSVFSGISRTGDSAVSPAPGRETSPSVDSSDEFNPLIDDSDSDPFGDPMPDSDPFAPDSSAPADDASDSDPFGGASF